MKSWIKKEVYNFIDYLKEIKNFIKYLITLSRNPNGL
jgi:hypothetical protein